MALIIISLLLLFSTPAYSQEVAFKQQLDRIIYDAQYNFRNSKGQFKDVFAADSTFSSKEEIEPSLRSEIIYNSEFGTFSFLATLDSSSERSQKRLVEVWRKKISKALGNDYRVTDVHQNWGTLGGTTGYFFTNGIINISITYTHGGSHKVRSKTYLSISQRK